MNTVAMGHGTVDRDSGFPGFRRALAVLRTAKRRSQREGKKGDDLMYVIKVLKTYVPFYDVLCAVIVHLQC